MGSTGPILRIAYSKIVQVVLLVQTRTTTSTTLVQACTTSTRLVQVQACTSLYVRRTYVRTSVQPCASLYAKYAKYSYKAALYKLYKLVQALVQACTKALYNHKQVRRSRRTNVCSKPTYI